MTTADLMGPELVVIDAPPCTTVRPGEEIKARLLASFLPGGPPASRTLRWRFTLADSFGGERLLREDTRDVERRQWDVVPVETATCQLPDEPGLVTLAAWFEESTGQVSGRNYVQWEVAEFEVSGRASASSHGSPIHAIRFSPGSYARADWPLSRGVNGGEKSAGFGAGFFEYEIPLPAEAPAGRWELLLEAGAKQTLPRDRDQLAVRPESDLTVFSAVAKWQSGSNPNDYPQTDEVRHPSTLEVYAEGQLIHAQELPDDPADARGVLSWHHQRSTIRLEDAGSYGYIVRCELPAEIVSAARREGRLLLRLSVPEREAVGTAGGLALYGARFGRYPFGPTLLIHPE
jgi:hypothetical protein